MSNAPIVKHPPSKYQQKLYDFIQFGRGNAVVNAVAGSGKTTSLINALEFIPQKDRVIFVAFSKAIAEELKTRTAHIPNVQVSTLHSVGMSALNKLYKPTLDERKVRNILMELCKKWSDIEKSDMMETMDRVKQLVDLGRMNMCSSIEDINEVAEKYGIDNLNGESDKAFECIFISSQNRNVIDFTDMVYLPAIDDTISFYQAKFVFVDEAQDMNKAQQKIVDKLVSPYGGRKISIGDNFQCIFGFGGADSEAFDRLRKAPNTIELPLSCTYRCAKSIVNYVRRNFPFMAHLECWEGAQAGRVEEKASIKDVNPSDFVLCRNTLPLVKCCLEHIGDGKKAYIKGLDIGVNLIRLMEKSKMVEIEGFKDWSNMELHKIIAKLKMKYPNITDVECKEHPSYTLFEEKIKVVKLIAVENKCELMVDIKAAIERIFKNDSEGIMFMTMHKSKGLEANNVFILPALPRKNKRQKAWEAQQEQNLLYVAYTRGKKSLNFITDWNYKD